MYEYSLYCATRNVPLLAVYINSMQCNVNLGPFFRPGLFLSAAVALLEDEDLETLAINTMPTFGIFNGFMTIHQTHVNSDELCVDRGVKALCDKGYVHLCCNGRPTYIAYTGSIFF